MKRERLTLVGGIVPCTACQAPPRALALVGTTQRFTITVVAPNVVDMTPHSEECTAL